MDSEFPGNSRIRKAAPSQREEKPKQEAVVRSNVVRRKKPLGKRFAETFGGDARGTGSFVIMDILMPAAKDMIVDAFTMGVERMVFGDSAPRGRRPGHNVFRQGNVGHTRYDQPSSIGRRDPREGMSRRARTNFEFDEILLSQRVEADEVLDRLFGLVEKYEAATVADLYDMINEDPKFTDYKYGWIDLTGSRVVRARGGGYLLDLPRPEPLD